MHQNCMYIFVLIYPSEYHEQIIPQNTMKIHVFDLPMLIEGEWNVS